MFDDPRWAHDPRDRDDDPRDHERDRDDDDAGPHVGRGPSSHVDKSEPDSRDRDDERWPERDRDSRDLDPSSCGISTCRRPTGGGVSLPGHELVRRRPPQVPPAARRTAPRATGMDAAGALPARADEDCEASGDRVDHAISQIRTAGDSVSMTTERRHDGPDLMHRHALADLRKNHSSIYLRGVRPTLGSWIREFRHCVGRPPARSRRDSAGLTALPLKTHNAFLEASLFVLGGRRRASLRPCHSGCGDELRGPGVRSCVHDC